MAETLEVSTFGYKLNKEDQQILHSLETGELVLEQVVSLADVEQSKALSSITRLIAVGYLRLVIIPHIWGVEFVLQPTGGFTTH